MTSLVADTQVDAASPGLIVDLAGQAMQFDGNRARDGSCDFDVPVGDVLHGRAQSFEKGFLGRPAPRYGGRMVHLIVGQFTGPETSSLKPAPMPLE